MDYFTTIACRRSIRRFQQKALPREAIVRMLEVARMAPTGTNAQPLCFAAVAEPSLCRAVFPYTRWAGLIPDGSAGPDEETHFLEHPAFGAGHTRRHAAKTHAFILRLWRGGKGLYTITGLGGRTHCGGCRRSASRVIRTGLLCARTS